MILDGNDILAAKELSGNGTVTAEVSQAGTYYMYIKDAGGSSYYDDDEYSITATYSSTTGARETESNDTLSAADLLIDGAALKGQLSSGYDKDYYKLDLSSSGTISVNFVGDGTNYYTHDVSILDASGNVLSKENVDDSETIIAKAESSGTYYVLVDDYGGSSYYDDEDYSITANIL